MTRSQAALALLVATLLCGCMTSVPSQHPVPSTGGPAFAAAYPPTDGSAWPKDLHGPFKALPIQHVVVAASDGITLDGYLRRPDLPSGVRGPILILSGPYLAATSADSDPTTPNPWVQAGYAYATFNVRGTGNSGGCMDFFGPNEQRDQAKLVDWAGNQTWGNGRVGMLGGSYDGTTVLEAAVQAPPALKAALAIAPVPDMFTMLATPQGALWTGEAAQLAAAFTGIAAAPRLVGDDPVGHLQGAAGKITANPSNGGRLCPEVVDAFAKLSQEPAMSARDSAFFKARDLRARLPHIRAPVLYTDGYYDDQYFSGAHVWPLFSGAPFEYRTGPWPHAQLDVPNGTLESLAIQWFDFWLKGVGEPPADLGHAIWEDTLQPGVAPNHGKGAWHSSEAWPPPEATMRRLNLSGPWLSATAAGTERSYRSAPIPEGTSAPALGPGGWNWPKTFLCEELSPASDAVRLIYKTDVATTPWLVAGIPTLDLNITSDQPGGIINAFLVDEKDGSGSCSGYGNGAPALISLGAVDLQYVADPFSPRAFPTGVATHVQLELTDIAQVVQPGHRLVLIVGTGNPVDHLSRYTPTVIIHPGTPEGPTLLTLPVVRR